MRKLFLLIGVLVVVSCSNSAGVVQPVSKFNPEVLGTWNDDNGCKMSLERVEDKLILRNFTNSKGVEYQNINLEWNKQSVFTVFTSTESNVKFTGSFSDGFITIDNGLCNKILRKENAN